MPISFGSSWFLRCGMICIWTLKSGIDMSKKGNDDVTLEAIKQYWNEHIHDLKIAGHPIGTEGFFKDLEQYRFEKLDYLPKVVDFSRYKNKNILEIGCGVGTDLIKFAEKGARVTGVDLAEKSIELAKKNFAFN